MQNILDPASWRYVGSEPTLAKWFWQCFLLLVDRNFQPLPDWVVGFRAGRQPSDIMQYARVLLQKGEELRFWIAKKRIEYNKQKKWFDQAFCFHLAAGHLFP